MSRPPAGRRPASRRRKPAAPEPLLPIVGIGASAGGLEALEAFLGAVPEGAHMAFVIVLHQDPTHKGMLLELLQRSTPLKVLLADDRMRVEPGHAYLNPPDKDVSLLHGVLHLLDPVAPRGLRLPIDFFFRSLAADRGEGGIAVVLSGMGSDGTLGLEAVKERGGVVLVQQPDTAKFDGMPRSALATGHADLAAPAEELPGRILAWSRRAAPSGTRSDAEKDASQSALGRILVLLRERTGHDFSLYKESTLVHRVERRIALRQADGIDAYVRLLRESPEELELLFKALLIGVTRFFRDGPAWQRLKDALTPAFLAPRSSGQALRAWVPGCATGQEAYSLAMVFKEASEEIDPSSRVPLQIFATDLDAAAIDRARTGLYPPGIAQEISPERLARFFVPVDGGYQVVTSIREAVVFAVQNVCMHAPFTRLDVLTCRNLLIYLGPDIQKKLLSLFHYSLKPGGLLLLGNAESLGARTDLFAPIDDKARLYRRLDVTRTPEPLAFPSELAPAGPPRVRAARAAPAPPPELGALAERLLLDRYSPPAVLVDRQGEILYVSGRTGRYLEPAPGEANWSLLAMAREGIRYELRRALPRALEDDGPVRCSNLLLDSGAGPQAVNLTLQAVREPAALRGLVVVTFEDAPQSRRKGRGRGQPAGGDRLAALERQLEQRQRELRENREEMRAAVEEFKATNEELQSTNEELQSTNEELTTSREEMQSMNEELETLNRELRARVDDLSRTNSDVRNLLDSTDNAVLFLDGALRVRLFTSGATRLFRLIPGDVGRPITDIANDLVLPELEEHLRQVLETLIVHEQEVATRDGRWFAMRVRPYRTLDNVIDGVVITLADVTDTRTLDDELRRARARLERFEGQAARDVRPAREPEGNGE